MDNTGQGSSPAAKPVVVTAEDTEQTHLEKIAGNLDQALEKPEKSSIESVTPAFDQQPLTPEVQKQAEQLPTDPETGMVNPPDKDSFWRHILPFRNKKVGDVAAQAMYNAKSEVVKKKGGQEAA
jgi:hypothetical protein